MTALLHGGPIALTPLRIIAVLGAGLFAGTVNAIVGSGSLLTFPTLLALGYPAVLANVSNTVGLVPGTVSGTLGYRRELAGQSRRAFVLAPVACLGGITGAALLLAFPSSFEAVIPWLVLFAVLLVIVQPRLSRRLAERGPRPMHGGPWMRVGVLLTAVYGGYFGAAQGVVLIGLLALGVDDSLQRLNALKNLLAAVVNGVAALIFIALTSIAWPPALLLAASSIVGGQIGARLGRRLPAPVLRVAIVLVGLAVALKLLIAR